MNNDDFERIGEISMSGVSFMESMIRTFGHDLNEFDRSELEKSLIVLIRSERLDAAAKTGTYFSNLR